MPLWRILTHFCSFPPSSHSHLVLSVPLWASRFFRHSASPTILAVSAAWCVKRVLMECLSLWTSRITSTASKTTTRKEETLELSSRNVMWPIYLVERREGICHDWTCLEDACEAVTETVYSMNRVFAPKCASCNQPILPAQVSTSLPISLYLIKTKKSVGPLFICAGQWLREFKEMRLLKWFPKHKLHKTRKKSVIIFFFFSLFYFRS